MPGVELVDPVGYSGVWTWVGVAMIVAVPAWFVWVFWSTRKRKGETDEAAPGTRRPASTMPGTTDPWAAVRRIYLAKLDDVDERHRKDELDPRGVHLEIRRVMREYTSARTGVDAATFTESDAARVSLAAPLAKMLKQLSYPSFAPRSTVQAKRSIENARRVVAEW